VRSASPGGENALANLGLALLGGVLAIAGILWGAGHIAAFVLGTTPPAADITGGFGVLARPWDPATPLEAAGLHPVAYWVTVTLLTAISGVAGWGGWRLFHTPRNQPTDLHHLDGTATRGEVGKTASARALTKKAAALRPSLPNATAAQLGYFLGRAAGKEVWATVEDSMLLIGPPRSGKGAHIVINAILDSPGPVVTTSTRPDNLAITMNARAAQGPVYVFDPQRLAEGIAAGAKWSPVRGCEDPTTAMIRAAGLAAATGFGGVEAGNFWEGKTRVAIQCLLHDAALDHRTPADLYQWTLNPAAARDAARILATNPDATPGWADALDGMLLSDPRTRDSIWHGVSLAFAALADPRVLAAVSPRPGEEFDPARFLAENGTLYLLATGAGASSSAALVAALIEDLVEVARRKAARSPRARLDPPLLMALDEIGNLAPLPSLPTLMAEGGGTGITMLPVLQSLATAREKWGEHNAATIWDAAIVKIILGGGSNPKDLHDLSSLLGDRDEETTSTTIDGYGNRSTQTSLRRVPVMGTEAIRTMPLGTGLILLRTSRPIIASLRFWKTRPDATQLEAQEARFAEHLAP